MILVFISETADRRLQARARAITAATLGTRVVFLCPRTTSGPRTYTRAGQLMRDLMVAMHSPLAQGTDFHPLRATADLRELAEAIRAEGADRNSRPVPAGPQPVSLVIVAETPRIWQLAEYFGLTADPAELVNVIDVDMRPAESTG
jgi:hypothetical protein